MRKIILALLMLVPAGCMAPPPRVSDYPPPPRESPPPRPEHHAAANPEPAPARLATVKPLGKGVLTAQTVENYMDNQERELRAGLRGSRIIVSRVGDNLALVIPADALFPGTSDDLSEKGQNVLTRIAFAARKFDSTQLSVSGFTDAKGTPLQNRQQSERRAEAVKKALAGDGVDVHRIEAKGYGSDNPRIPTPPGVSESRNRRVEIEIAPLMKG